MANQENMLLQPLRIPTGWTVNWNTFYEAAEPKDFTEEGTDYRFHFTEDILQISKENIMLDLGWYPEFSLNGQYILRLIKDFDWQNPKERLCSRNKAEVIAKIESLLKYK